MESIAQNAPVCKDGANAANARLSELTAAFDSIGFRILRMETNGLDFDLKIRDGGNTDED